MRASKAFAVLVWAFAGPLFAQSDVEVTASATPNVGLALNHEVLIHTVIRNLGPAPAIDADGYFHLPPTESFWFQLIGAETPGCVAEPLDVSPPTFLVGWSFVDEAPLVPGGERACAIRMSVRLVPPSSAAHLSFSADAQGADPNAANNSASVTLLFGSGPSTRRSIPSASPTALALLVALSIAFAFAVKRGRGMCAALPLLIAVGWGGPARGASPPQLFTQIIDASSPTPPRALSAFIVEVNHLSLPADPAQLELHLPGSGTYIANRAQFISRAGGGFHWVGKTPVHDVILTVDHDVITGFIRGGADTYAIESASEPDGAAALLLRMDPSAFPPDFHPENADVAKGPLLNIEEPRCFGATDDPIDILVVYSPETLAKVGGNVDLLRNQLENAAASADVTLANSNVEARTRIAAVLPAPPDLVEDGSEDDIENARENLQVRASRRAHRADVVFYLTSEGKYGTHEYCGMARTQRRAGGYAYGMGYHFYDSAVAVLVYQCGVQNNDLSHELGHIGGLDHNPPDHHTGTPTTNLYPFAFGHHVSGQFRDDMSQTNPVICPQPCARQMFFSDPAAFTDGFARGTSSRNNAGTYRRSFRCTNSLADYVFGDHFE